MNLRFDEVATGSRVPVAYGSRRSGEDRNEGARGPGAAGESDLALWAGAQRWPPRAPPAEVNGGAGISLARGRRWGHQLAVLFFALAPSLTHALDLNTATRAQLEQLSGVGVTMADRLLEERARRPFRDWDDLAARVKGMRGARVERLREQGFRIDQVPALREPK